MENARRFIRSLLRLNDLETTPPALWARELTKFERQLAIAQARKGLPTYLLGHHDRRIGRGKRSVAVVHHGICSACHMKLPTGHHRRKGGEDLDVCDHCGVFLIWETEEVFPPSGEAQDEPKYTPPQVS